MGISHIALAVQDLEATHRFYTDIMGFELVKVEIADMRGGKARHAFYSTGSADDQMIAFWDLRGVPGFEDGYRTDISRDLGLDPFTNHLAFQADDLDDLAAKRNRLKGAGLQVVEIDHGWIQSVYAEDPDGNVVEFAIVTEAFTKADAVEALELLTATDPPMSPAPSITFHPAPE
ncbi:MAG: VOC family protein [Actinomycetota bacterium]